ncbi:hypothetical protein FS749_000962 [Ceratobasidium sp. UAMH 11750]|nr:hypothetical protein FS749_000962 [Ceratobasidium sp. UAMH 11750]
MPKLERFSIWLHLEGREETPKRPGGLQHIRRYIGSLSDCLDDISSEFLRTLKDILVPLLKADAKPKHGVCCHRVFREKDNNGKCVVPCGEWRTTPHEDPEYDCYDLVELRCCGKMPSEGELEEPDGEEGLVCYMAKHTVDPTTVKYFIRDG